MKQTIDRKTYDTDTATRLAEWSTSLAVNDFRHHIETLYRTAKGNYFLHAVGGPMSPYAEHAGNESRSGSAIRPLTPEEALAWCEKREMQDVIDQHFADQVEEA